METGLALIERVANEIKPELFDGNLSPRKFEARLIVENITGDNYSEIVSGNYELNIRQIHKLEEILNKRNLGTPLAYVLNSISFREIDLYVDERVLIPRPETEFVVQCALERLLEVNSEEITVIDIGTGSGAIALSIAQENKKTRVLAVDISLDAIEVAKLNGIAIGSPASRVQFFCSDLLAELPKFLKGKVDLIISNPPYIGLDEIDTLDNSVLENEPHLALFSGEKGDEHYKLIIEQSKQWLSPRSSLVLEIAPRHVDVIQKLAVENDFSSVEIIDDLTMRSRVAVLTVD